jgi:hypothetical protein
MHLIGVTGRIGAGKDTVCNMAKELLVSAGKRAEVIACADPLKQICFKIFGTALGIPETAFFGSQAQKEAALAQVPGWSGRRILQYIGTEGFRTVHSNVWAAYMFQSAKVLFSSGVDVVFVSDVRFPSESNIIQSNGGRILRVYRNSVDIIPATHASERELENISYDYRIDNHDRDLYSLQELVKDFLCRNALISSHSTPRPPG